MTMLWVVAVSRTKRLSHEASADLASARASAQNRLELLRADLAGALGI